jgi:hypothetical protein
MKIPLNYGWVTSRHEADLIPGELSVGTGAYYKPGDTNRAHKIWGRTAFGLTTAAKVKGVFIAGFDTADDLLVASTGTDLYTATAGSAGTFAALTGATGLSASSTNLSGVHSNDRWYFHNGYDYGRVLESDGTVVRHGMDWQHEKLVCTPSAAAAAKQYPVTVAGTGWQNTANTTDGSETTFASGTLSASGSIVLTCSAWGAATDLERSLIVVWKLAGSVEDVDPKGPGYGIGGSADAGYGVHVKIEKSEDGGISWGTTPLYDQRYMFATGTNVIESKVGNWGATPDSALVQCKITLTYNRGTSPATLQVHEVLINTGGDRGNFSTATGFYYTITESDQTRGWESSHAPVSDLVTMTDQNKVTVALPTKVNANATQFNIYRTTDGGVFPYQAFLVGTAIPGEGSWVDRFKLYDKDTQGSQFLPLVQISANDGTTDYYSANKPPPALQHLNIYKGSLVGTYARSIYYSQPGYPEQWPEINVIATLSLPENDTIVATQTVGDSLLILTGEAVLRMDDLPRVVQGVFNAAEVIPLRGAPGCVGHDACVTFSVAGEPRCAWVSYFGIYETNGVIVRRLTTDMDWKTDLSVSSLTSSVLRWDAENLCLVFAYDSDDGGVNDRYAILHMASEHQKDQGPKITGPHYANMSCYASGMVNGTYRRYSGHTSNGYVYVEGGTTDASGAYSSTTVPLLLTTGKYDGNDRFAEFDTGATQHSDAGSSQSLTVIATAGDDYQNVTQVVTKTVSLNSNGKTPFLIARAGQWLQLQLQHTGAASFSLAPIDVSVRGQGKQGKVLT